jgi:hypothetical protein
VVSNHGGRILDFNRAALEALPEVLDAVGGKVPPKPCECQACRRCSQGVTGHGRSLRQRTREVTKQPRALGRRSRRGAAVVVVQREQSASRQKQRPPRPSHVGALESSGSGAALPKRDPTGCKGDLLSRNQCRACPDTDACNALKGTLPPAMGTTCGRREREADAGNEEERSSPVPAVCNGGRHPGSQDADCLRGWSVECGSWSVRRGRLGLVPGGRSHRRQQVSSGRMRRGTWAACARRTHSSWQTPNKRLHARGHVLRSVQRPVHVNRH